MLIKHRENISFRITGASNAACHCGSKECRKHCMRWIHELPSVASGITADLKEFMEYGVFV
jgi:hypothetical protein